MRRVSSVWNMPSWQCPRTFKWRDRPRTCRPNEVTVEATGTCNKRRNPRCAHKKHGYARYKQQKLRKQVKHRGEIRRGVLQKVRKQNYKEGTSSLWYSSKKSRTPSCFGSSSIRTLCRYTQCAPPRGAPRCGGHYGGRGGQGPVWRKRGWGQQWDFRVGL